MASIMQNHTPIHAARRVGLLLFLGLLTGLVLAPQTFAQRGDPAQMQERLAAQTEDTIKQLGLTDDQQEPVRTILEEQNKKRMDLREQARASGSFGGMREQMMALAEETETRLAEVLTDEQMATYRKIMEERAARRGMRRGGPGNN